MSTRAELYGSGVFTTVRIIDRKPWLWEKHWKRLEHDAPKLGIDLKPLRSESVLRNIDETIPDDHLGVRKLRITIEDRRPAPLWSDEEPQFPAGLTFLEGEIREVPKPFRLGLSTHLVNSTSPIAGLKTCNYLEQTLALDAAKEVGSDEAVRLNEKGHVTSACMANIFWLKDDALYTPALSTGCLPGTTREFVLENFSVNEVEAPLRDFRKADAIFLSSAGLGVVSVDEFDGRAMSIREHPILSLVPEKN